MFKKHHLGLSISCGVHNVEVPKGVPKNLVKLIYADKVPNAFIKKVMKICKDFGWGPRHANWLMACIAFESNYTFSSRIRNYAGSGATGLIQFMPSTALGLGTSIAELVEMNPTQQLDYVKKYFKPYHKRIKSLGDMYMAILMPKYVGKPPNEVIFSGGAKYRQNSGLDINKDGKVTIAEACSKVRGAFANGSKYAQNIVWEDENV